MTCHSNLKYGCSVFVWEEPKTPIMVLRHAKILCGLQSTNECLSYTILSAFQSISQKMDDNSMHRVTTDLILSHFRFAYIVLLLLTLRDAKIKYWNLKRCKNQILNLKLHAMLLYLCSKFPFLHLNFFLMPLLRKIPAFFTSIQQNLL